MRTVKLNQNTKLIHYAAFDCFLDWLVHGLYLPDASHFSQSDGMFTKNVSNFFFKGFMMNSELDAYFRDQFAGTDAVIIETTLGALDSWFGDSIKTNEGPGTCFHGEMKYVTESQFKKMDSHERVMSLPKYFSVETEYRIVVQLTSCTTEPDHVYVQKNLTGLFHTAHIYPAHRISEVNAALSKAGLSSITVVEATFS